MDVVSVLVVDDQEPVRAAMSAVVDATDGFDVIGAVGSGEESVLAAARLNPDLVLMDVNLPGIDGIEATRRIMRAGAPDAPVVLLLSTYDEDDFDLDGCGAAAYVPKGSFGPARLVSEWLAATSSSDTP